MKWQEMIIDGYGRVSEALEEALDCVTRDDLDKQPAPACNTMGWLAWHLTRVQDDHIADLMGETQIWIEDEWYSAFQRKPDPKDIGFGHSAEEVSAFVSPDSNTLLSYHESVLNRTKQYIRELSASDLDRVLDEPWFQPLPTVGVRIVSVLSDCLQHVGQIAYLRGLLKGKGWLPY